MKGAIKSIKRAPHLLTTKVGIGSKSEDAETTELVRKFSGLEEYTAKLLKDSVAFRDACASLLASQAGFGTAFTQLFQDASAIEHPEAATTLKHITGYQEVMAELRDSIQPELELIDGRVVTPLKEYQELLKKIRKTITKREHKLVDYDRFNNSYTKLQGKAEKSLSDEKNLFKLEQDLELATQEYEHYNSLLKNEIPHFLKLTTAFISPIFQTFYFVKVGILYTLLEKMQGWSGSTYGDFDVASLESMHQSRMGEAAQQLESLTITKRGFGTARLVSQHRQATADSGSTSLGRAGSTTSSFAAGRKVAPSTIGNAGGSTAASYSDPAPPPYSGGAAAASAGLAGKRPPPPPPPGKPRAGQVFVTALYDYAATAEGDLSFAAGDKIELVKKTASTEDWWTGKLQGVEGVFPGNYVQL